MYIEPRHGRARSTKTDYAGGQASDDLCRSNYIYFGGGDITFGKLTMHGADLQLIDADPRDPFDFHVARYNAQLVAGYSKNTPAKGLKTFMPDFEDLGRRPR